MKKLLCHLLAATFAIGSSLAAPSLAPGALRCEYRVDPLGVDVAKPRLDWIVQSANPKLRGLRQTAYQILVASSPELLARDQGDLWNSGTVRTDATAQIVYDGKPMRSNQPAWWKVRVADQAGTPSPWSPVARWTMGIVAEADWQGAKWIASPDAAQPAPKGTKPKYETLLLRQDFVVKPGLKRAILNISGLGQYEFTLNGAKVGDALLAPGWTDYKKTCLYDTYDVTAALRPGPNAAGIFLGNGFFNVHEGRYTKVRGTFGPIQAIGLLRLEYADGSVQNVVTDEQWKVLSGPITFSSIYGGEDYDARLLPANWDRPGFSAKEWEAPTITAGPGGALRGISVSAPPIRTMEVRKPVSTKELSPSLSVHNFGQNASFMVAITVKGPAGSSVKMTPSELVHGKGDINERMCRGDSYWVYTLNGQGEERYFSKFYYRGGQYLQVELKPATGSTKLPEVTSVEAHIIRADSPVAGQFTCSNELYDKISGLVRWAQMSNMMSVLTDCPHREKLGWLEQIHLNGPALRYNFDMSAIFAKMTNDMFDAQRANGLVPSLVPNYYGWAEGKFTTPIEWGSACILVPWQQYEFEGDLELLRANYDGMKRYMDYLGRRAKNHIIDFGLGDWYDNHGEGSPTLTPVAATSTAFYYQNFQIMAQIADLLGKKDDAGKFRDTGKEVLKAYNDKFFDPKTNNYATGSQGSNCLPLAFGMVDPKNAQAVFVNLVNDLKAKGTTVGEVSFKYLLEVLANGGLSELVYKTYGTEKEGYGLQVKLGKTSLTEAWNGGNSSQNHFMFGQINQWMFQYLAGIQTDLSGPGFQKFVIRPAPVRDLKFVKATYDSIRGPIVSNWALTGNRFTMDITIPPNTTATVFVPATTPATVTEGGRPITRTTSHIKFLRAENNAAVFQVSSGTYRFTTTLPPPAPSLLAESPALTSEALIRPAQPGV